MAIKCFLLEETDQVDEKEEFGEDGRSIGKSKSPLYKRSDTGQLVKWRDAPVGAIVRATWLEDLKEYCGPDGKSYMVRTPGGDWMIDSRASNCGLPNDNEHKCWCRHGVAPNFTVDKSCKTCKAGAGSIAIGGYHGFLKNGFLTE